MKKNTKVLVIIFIIIMIFLSSNGLFAQFKNPTKDVKFNFDDKVEIPSEGSTKLNIEVIVPKDNHIYVEHLTEDGFTILTQFEIEEGTGFRITDVKKPDGEIEGEDLVLRGKGNYVLTIENISKFDINAEIEVPLYIRSQMCNDVSGVCYPPYDNYDKVITFIITEDETTTVSSEDVVNQGGFTNPTENIKFNYEDNINISYNNTISFNIDVIVPEGNHIYIDHIEPESMTILTSFKLPDDSGFEITKIDLPKGEIEGPDLVLRDKGTFTIHVKQTKELDDGGVSVPFNITSQMCSDESGLCYRPYSDFNKSITFNVVKDGNLIEQESEGTEQGKTEGIEDDRFKYPLVALLFMFLGGLLTSVLPCTYPIIPLTVSYLGSKENKNLMESFINSIIYVLGMAVIYAMLGVLAVLLGKAFGSFAFHPFVLTPLIILLMYFMFSMFGYYEIQLPAFMQSLKSETAQKSKSKGGIFLFGMVAGLVATPCALPVVGAALIYIATSVQETTNTFQYMLNLGYGFTLMFVFAMGLGVLFILLGTFSGLRSKLPKSGNWMVIVLRILGVVLAGVVVYYLHELFTSVQIGFSEITSWLLSIGIVGTILGILLLQEKHPKGRNVKNDLLIGSSVILIVSGIIFQTISIVVLGTDVLNFSANLIILIISLVLGVLLALKTDFSNFMFPKVKDLFSGLSIFFIMTAVVFGTSITFDRLGIEFNQPIESQVEAETIGGIETLPYEEALQKAKENDKLIFLDFWATWCTNCAEFEEFAEENEEMQEFLSNFLIVRMNYDLNMDFALNKFNVKTLPNFVFINHKEEVVLRKFGFANPKDFLEELKSDFKDYLEK